MKEFTIETDIRDHYEGAPVEIKRLDNGRYTVVAYNQGGNDATAVDLLDVIKFYEDNKDLFNDR